MSLAQLTLFDATPELDRDSTPRARHCDPDTSVAAAAAQTPKRLSAARWNVLELLSTAGGLTDFELAERLWRQQTSVGKRRGELRDLGLVEDSGHRRPSPSGTNAIVWRVTPAGFSAFLDHRSRPPETGAHGEVESTT